MLTLHNTLTQQKLFLRQGQRASIGRTFWADWSCTDDATMEEVHFELHYDDGKCHLHDLSGRKTALNGAAIEDGRLHSGDQITAGATTFRIEWDERYHAQQDGEPAQLANASPGIKHGDCDVGQLEDHAVWIGQFTFEQIATWTSVGADFQSNIARFSRRRDLIGLISHATASDDSQQMIDAIKFTSLATTTHVATAWVLQCCRATAANNTQALAGIIETAENWLQQPSIDHRQAALHHTNQVDIGEPAYWIARAIAWSGGLGEINQTQPDANPESDSEGESELGDETTIEPIVPSDQSRLETHTICANATLSAVLLAANRVQTCSLGETLKQFISIACSTIRDATNVHRALENVDL